MGDLHRPRVYENRMLRGIFGPKMEGVRGEWTKLHIKELNNLYCLSNVIRVIKSRRMRWAGHVAHMERYRSAYRFRWGNLKERDHLEDTSLSGKIILRWSSGSAMGGMDWIELAQDKNRRQTLVNTVMNFRFP